MAENFLSPSKGKALETFPKVWTVGVDATCRSKLPVQAAMLVPNPSHSLPVSHGGCLAPRELQQLILYISLGLKFDI